MSQQHVFFHLSIHKTAIIKKETNVRKEKLRLESAKKSFYIMNYTKLYAIQFVWAEFSRHHVHNYS